MTLADLFDAGSDPDPRTGERIGERIVAHDRDGSHTRAEVEAATHALVARLSALEPAPGAPVAVMLPDTVDVIVALLAVWRAGGAYLPLNPRLTDTELGRLLDAVPPTIAVTTAEHAHRLPAPVVVIGAAPDDVAGAARDVATHDRGTALVMLTSGTTGAPKAVLLTHDGVLRLIDGVLERLRGNGPRSDDRARPPMPNLVPVSLSLWAGIYQVLFAFRVGAPVVLMERFEPVAFAGLVRRFGLRSTVLPPAAMTMLTDEPAVSDLGPLRYVRSITAALSPLQARRFHDRFGVRVLNGYGQTELGGEVIGWSAADSREHGDAKLGAVGRPHPGVEVSVRDDAGDEVPRGTSGGLWVRAPARSAGYAAGGVLSDRLDPDGFLFTGDHAHVDPEGFVWIDGRAGDMINRGGLKVFPDEVEEVLRLSPAVRDVCVVGVADDRLGEVPVAAVVPTGPDLPVRDLDALARSHLAPYKVPVRFVAVADLDRNEVGKVSRPDVRRVLEASPGPGQGTV